MGVPFSKEIEIVTQYAVYVKPALIGFGFLQLLNICLLLLILFVQVVIFAKLANVLAKLRGENQQQQNWP